SEWGDIVADSPDRQARIDACKVIIRMGKEGLDAKDAIKGLMATINDDDLIIRGWAAVAMTYAVRGTMYPGVGPVLMPKVKVAAESDDEELRAEAKIVLENMP